MEKGEESVVVSSQSQYDENFYDVNDPFIDDGEVSSDYTSSEEESVHHSDKKTAVKAKSQK